uniref:F-box domain-containing protein n=1 Tax=Heterorhabditis bacteriophora TaxID=37862 RepID=A0A1I7WDE9_HETBA
MAGQDTKLESKAHTYKRPQDCLITSPTSALASASHERNHTSISEQANRPDHWITDLICRLPLPTLFYRLEAVHLEDLMRISINSLPRFFKGRSESTRHHRNRGALRKQRPYLRMNRFQGVRSLTREENSSSVSKRRYRVRMRYRASNSKSHNLYRILTLFPFDIRERRNDRLTHIQLLFTWNPSPLQSSRIELKYLLLPPRSALMEAPAGPTP